MSARRLAFAALAFAGAAAAQTAPAPAPDAARPPREAIEYGLFGTLHLARPPGPIAHTVMLVSDAGGWSARQDALAAALAGEGAFVVGIDLPAYLQRMESIGDKCAFPAAHFEEAAHWIERHEGLAAYSYPLVVGDGAGATFAYAMIAQAPAGTFEGLVSLGWDARPRFPKEFCAGDAGAMTAPAQKGGFRIVPVAHFPVPWWPRPFAPGARTGGLLAPLAGALRVAERLWSPFPAGDAAAALGRLYADWRGREESSAAALPDDVADLPLTDLPPAAPAAGGPRIAIILTGDGGWAGLDRGVADALTAHGVHVVGFSTLKFFWQRQTPEATAAAVGRVIAHYAKGAADPRFVLIGYSFGASLVPVVANRLPEALRARVQAGVMISPDDEAVFEIHVGDWFGSTHHDEAIPLAPEMAASRIPLVCVHGSDEDDSFCLKPQPAQVRVVALPGGHHYDGNYDKLGELIARSLPAAGEAR